MGPRRRCPRQQDLSACTKGTLRALELALGRAVRMCKGPVEVVLDRRNSHWLQWQPAGSDSLVAVEINHFVPPRPRDKHQEPTCDCFSQGGGEEDIRKQENADAAGQDRARHDSWAAAAGEHSQFGSHSSSSSRSQFGSHSSSNSREAYAVQQQPPRQLRVQWNAGSKEARRYWFARRHKRRAKVSSKGGGAVADGVGTTGSGSADDRSAAVPPSARVAEEIHQQQVQPMLQQLTPLKNRERERRLHHERSVVQGFATGSGSADDRSAAVPPSAFVVTRWYTEIHRQQAWMYAFTRLRQQNRELERQLHHAEAAGAEGVATNATQAAEAVKTDCQSSATMQAVSFQRPLSERAIRQSIILGDVNQPWKSMFD